MSWQGKKVLVLGAARQGLSAARFLARQYAKVLLNDQRAESEFSHLRAELHQLNIETCFGSHPFGLLQGVDLLCISGGVPLDHPIVQKALDTGIPLTNDTQIFFESVKTRVVGITGSAGKTTTTIMLGEIAKKAVSADQSVWVGGNIGYPMLDHADEIRRQDWVIIELSSFQLELVSVSPNIAVILNITPNHLDRHKHMKDYIAAKTRIIQFQKDDNVAILNRDDHNFTGLLEKVKGNVITFGDNPPSNQHKSIYLEEDRVKLKDGGDEKTLLTLDCLQLPGKHNIMNMLAACAVSCAAGFSPEAMRLGIEQVKSIPHRLELIRDFNGVRWVNDSIATAPERVIAAVNTVQSPLILLLGGRDKDLPWEELAKSLHKFKPTVILFGEAAEKIYATLEHYEKGTFPYRIFSTKNLEEAVYKASQISLPGDTVLLSPGGTSYDAYFDFEERGNHFRHLVEAFA